MAIANLATLRADDPTIDSLRDSGYSARGPCFLCNSDLWEQTVYLQGGNGKMLALHGRCARDLGCLLIGDSAAIYDRVRAESRL